MSVFAEVDSLVINKLYLEICFHELNCVCSCNKLCRAYFFTLIDYKLSLFI